MNRDQAIAFMATALIALRSYDSVHAVKVARAIMENVEDGVRG